MQHYANDLFPLPGASLLPFQVSFHAGAELVYCRPDQPLSADEILRTCAWIVSESSRSPRLTDETRMFYAERYGGNGIGANGGGVRCGLSGEFQIKGIGCNPLLGLDTPLDYSHGGMSLFECIQESLWSEIFAFALPYGAVNSIATISLDEQCWWVVDRWGADALSQRYGSPPNLPRGLHVRSPAVRPAHFERAASYRPAASGRLETRIDVERTKRAQELLPHVLPVPEGLDLSGASLIERLKCGFDEMACRFAVQSAAAKSKRLIHGNITSSNISLDGKWLDFGSATAIPNWGPACGYGPFWDDSELYLGIFYNLIYQSQKFLNIDSTSAEMLVESATQTYKSVHDLWLGKRFASMTGLPWCLFESQPIQSQALHLSRVMIRIIKIGGQGYLSPHPDNHASYGTFRLYELLHSLARLASAESQRAAAIHHLADEGLADELISAYRDLVAACASEAASLGVSPNALRTLMILGTQKRRNIPDVLYRERMVKISEELVLGCADTEELRASVDALHESVMEQVRISLDDASVLGTVVKLSKGRKYFYDAVANVFKPACGETQGLDLAFEEASSEFEIEM